MPDAYTITEARFIQEGYAASAANADSVSIGPVPNGKIWTVVAAQCWPSAADTQDWWWAIGDAAGTHFAVTEPTNHALSTTVPWPLVTQGMELKLYPRQYLWAHRGNHAAGSTIVIRAMYIETDLPLYDYIEPQEALRIQKFRRSLVPSLSRIGRGGYGGGGGGGREGGGLEGGGGGSRSEPK